MRLIGYSCVGMLMGLLHFVPAAHADDGCVAAVDAADSMNLNRKDCDYSDKGLNGVLHKAFKKGGEGAVMETQAKNSVDEEKSVAAKTTGQTKVITSTPEPFSLHVEVDQWSSVTLARAQLLPKAMERCSKGFSIQRENYRPLAMGRIALNMEFICLE